MRPRHLLCRTTDAYNTEALSFVETLSNCVHTHTLCEQPDKLRQVALVLEEFFVTQRQAKLVLLNYAEENPLQPRALQRLDACTGF